MTTVKISIFWVTSNSATYKTYVEYFHIQIKQFNEINYNSLFDIFSFLIYPKLKSSLAVLHRED